MKPMIVIAGATSVGKTSLSIRLAKMLNAEIISADSMQIYKGMDIGTAKPSLAERHEVPHHMLDEVFPDETFSVALFQRIANNYLADIYARNKIPIIVGGTGLYINAILYDNQFAPCDLNLREELYRELDKPDGKQILYDRLLKLKPDTKIHINNIKRVIRMLELNGEQEIKPNLKYHCVFIVLNMDRQILYERIEKRVDVMIREGLLDEVKWLLERYDSKLNSMQGIGYKELISFLHGDIEDYNQAIELIKRNSRRYAKRQITWFKHQTENSVWLDALDSNLLNNAIEICKGVL